MNRVSPTWVAAAARWPIAFAQVREDAAIDRAITARLPPAARVLMVASGGCTAALLAAVPRIARIGLVDPNPAQLALTRLKLHLLTTEPPARRAALLGHEPLDPAERHAWLAANLQRLGLEETALGPLAAVAAVGPDHAGRYEALFVALREHLAGHAAALQALLELHDPAEQAARLASNAALNHALDAAFDEVFALPNLVALFGAAATQNAAQPFSRHFAARTRHTLATLPAATNPYLWQVMMGQFPPGIWNPWLTADPPAPMPAVAWTNSFMDDALVAAPDEYDLVHLSNILDWLAPDQARHTLQLAWRALRPGGWVVIRQLNSRLDVPALAAAFAWDGPAADVFHADDRSYFYRALFLGQKL